MMTADAISPREAALPRPSRGLCREQRSVAPLRRGRTCHELQALNVRFGNAVRTYFAHAQDASQMTNLVLPRREGVRLRRYLRSRNPIKPAVATRAEVSKRHPRRGESTTDSDIAARMVFVCDVDAGSPEGHQRHRRGDGRDCGGSRAHLRDVRRLLRGRRPLAYGHSGNGRMVPRRARRSPERGAHPAHHEGDLDRSMVCSLDPRRRRSTRRLRREAPDPGVGYDEEKGAPPNVAERPHRCTALLLAPTVTRASMAGSRGFATLRVDCSAETNALIDREFGVKPCRLPRHACFPGPTSPVRRANEPGSSSSPGPGSWTATSFAALVAAKPTARASCLINNGARCRTRGAR